jgi:hypothetical protein
MPYINLIDCSGAPQPPFFSLICLKDSRNASVRASTVEKCLRPYHLAISNRETSYGTTDNFSRPYRTHTDVLPRFVGGKQGGCVSCNLAFHH